MPEFKAARQIACFFLDFLTWNLVANMHMTNLQFTNNSTWRNLEIDASDGTHHTLEKLTSLREGSKM